MGTIIKRAILPVLLLGGGIGSLIYGARFHTVPVVAEVSETVTEEQVREVELPPEMFQPPPFMEDPPPPFVVPQPPPIMVKETIVVEKKVTREVTRYESEPSLMLDATIGGLPMVVSGELRRPLGETSGGGETSTAQKGPALCPT